jgi:hypothetical protein
MGEEPFSWKLNQNSADQTPEVFSAEMTEVESDLEDFAIDS